MSTTTKRKSPDDAKTAQSNTISFTARNPTWTYLKLQLIHQPGTPSSVQCRPLDPLTARTYLTAALSQFLGLMGTTVSVDILKVAPEMEQEKPTEKIVWIRVPRQDASAVVAAVSSWIGGGSGGEVGNVSWRICAKGNYLGALVQGSGDDLFTP
ncbi:hypothetical protein BDV59DRAFT_204662 [Aspergillus ambiguus]|uniref:uncharacterized protein n=1 Tax=Aspergillus ambiguus TaxID=176160 RepID=UPI003CCE2D65